jgi:hypothetical protein
MLHETFIWEEKLRDGGRDGLTEWRRLEEKRMPAWLSVLNITYKYSIMFSSPS